MARRHRAVEAAELAATPLVAREPGSGTRCALEAVRTAVFSSLTVAGEVADGRLVALHVAGVDLTRTLRAVWPAGQPLTGVLRDVLAVATTRSPTSSAVFSDRQRERGHHNEDEY